MLVMSAQAQLSSTPAKIELSGETGEYLNATITFNTDMSDTLTGYEKWAATGTNLNSSLRARDFGIELNYPKVLEVKDGEAVAHISVRAEKAGNYTGAIYYRAGEAMGIAAGTWIILHITGESVDLGLAKETPVPTTTVEKAQTNESDNVAVVVRKPPLINSSTLMLIGGVVIVIIALFAGIMIGRKKNK